MERRCVTSCNSMNSAPPPPVEVTGTRRRRQQHRRERGSDRGSGGTRMSHLRHSMLFFLSNLMLYLQVHMAFFILQYDSRLYDKSRQYRYYVAYFPCLMCNVDDAYIGRCNRCGVHVAPHSTQEYYQLPRRVFATPNVFGDGGQTGYGRQCDCAGCH